MQGRAGVRCRGVRVGVRCVGTGLRGVSTARGGLQGPDAAHHPSRGPATGTRHGHLNASEGDPLGT